MVMTNNKLKFMAMAKYKKIRKRNGTVLQPFGYT